MAIEHCVVRYTGLRINLKVLNTAVSIFHSFSLTNICNDSCVESLNKKFLLANSKCVLRPQIILLTNKESLIEATRFLSQFIQIVEHYSVVSGLKVDLKMTGCDSVSLNRDKLNCFFASEFILTAKY